MRRARLVTVVLLVAAIFSCGSRFAAGSGDSGGGSVSEGEWGGEHIRLVVSAKASSLEFDCATGRIKGPLHTDSEGNFGAPGSWAPERGGPVHPDQRPPAQRPAHYSGWTDGTTMRLTVTLTETDRTIGTFSLRLGQRSLLEKCL